MVLKVIFISCLIMISHLLTEGQARILEETKLTNDGHQEGKRNQSGAKIEALNKKGKAGMNFGDEKDLPSVPNFPFPNFIPGMPFPNQNPNIPQIPGIPNIPQIPGIPNIPQIPNIPIPQIPNYIPQIPNIPVPQIPEIPNIPQIPNMPIPQIPDMSGFPFPSQIPQFPAPFGFPYPPPYQPLPPPMNIPGNLSPAPSPI